MRKKAAHALDAPSLHVHLRTIGTMLRVVDYSGKGEAKRKGHKILLDP